MRPFCAATANVSARAQGETKLGTKTEVKNMNSFSAVERALQLEFERQWYSWGDLARTAGDVDHALQAAVANNGGGEGAPVGVLLRNRRMRPQAVAKPDPIMPEGTPEWHEVKMVCSLSETGLTEPVHDICSIRRILVS